MVRSAGLGLNLYLSHVGEQVVGGYGTQLATLGQVADRLRRDGVIVTKQRDVLDYLVAMRNAAEHPDTDPDINPERWTINPKSAQTYLRVSLDIIRTVEAKRSNRHEL